MKIFNILDDDLGKIAGALLYFEKEGSYIIELSEDLDEWSAPLLLSAFVKKGIYTIPREVSKMWVSERVIPSGRQNINQILKKYRLSQYDELKLLELSGGRCAQDRLYIKKTDKYPDFAENRRAMCVTECFFVDGETFICFFNDETVRSITLTDLIEYEDVKKIINNDELKSSCRIVAGGYAISFGNSIDIPCRVLHAAGKMIPLKPNAFSAFVKNNLVDTSESCRMLECSRQNMSYLIKAKQLEPLKQVGNNALYSKGMILKSQW